MVTRCSCIASSSADCVFGGVRLISSARTMLLKIGPGANTIWRLPLASSLMRSVPVMSDGIRSGVNWMRVNFRSTTRASVCTSSVFASPGTPTIRLLPPTKSVSRIWLITSSCPTISFFSSATMCCRPAFILSASATSSADERSTVSGLISMRQSINEEIHANLERLVRLVDRLDPGAGPLPELRHVRVVPDHHHQPLAGVVVFVNPAEDRRPRIVEIRNLAERVDLEERVEDRMRHVEVDDLRIGQHAAHLRLEVAPMISAKVVDDDEAALLQIRAKRRRFIVGDVPAARLAEVDDGVLEELGIVERHHVGLVDVRLQVADLVEDLHHVPLAFGVIVRPRNALRLVGDGRAVAKADKDEPRVIRRVRLDRRVAAAAEPAEPALGEGASHGQRTEDESERD